VSSFVEFREVSKFYKSGELKITAVDKISFQIEQGEFVVIVGPSGAGKTTVLNMLGGMDTCDEGQILLEGREISSYNARQLTAYRRYDVGFVFQFYNLVQNLTALENVELASQICRAPLDAENTLANVGLVDRMQNFPAQLSGGEQQRVAIARALAKNPKLLLCDEPTGALDYNTGKTILQLLQDTCRNTGKTVIVITHNQAITAMADRVIKVKNGTVVSSTVNEAPTPVERIEW
jgi:putative ABC transport system ATP-binding protein